MFSTDGVVWSPIAMPSDFSAAVAGNGADIRFFGDMGFAYVCQPEQTTCSRWTVTLDG